MEIKTKKQYLNMEIEKHALFYKENRIFVALNKKLCQTR